MITIVRDGKKAKCEKDQLKLMTEAGWKVFVEGEADPQDAKTADKVPKK